MPQIKFDCTREEFALIDKIAQFGEQACKTYGVPFCSRLNVSMDLAAVHKNGCPLDLKKLSEFDDENLLHDLCGITRHLDRATGKLGDFFLPRCALHQAGSAA